MTPDYPPVWLAGFAVVSWGLGEAYPVILPGAATLGWALAGLALGLMAVAAMQMLSRHTTLDPHGEASALVTRGAFALSRNPIYLADAVLLAGLALIFHAPHALLLVPLFATVITRRFIRPEERRLARRFPQEFARWAARTRRWL